MWPACQMQPILFETAPRTVDTIGLSPPRSGKTVLNWETFAAHDAWAPVFAEEPLAIHLDNRTIIGHDGLTWILGITAWRQRRGWATYLYLPTSPTTLSFLRDELRFLTRYTAAGGAFVNEPVLWNAEIDKESQRRQASRKGVPEVSPRYIQQITPASHARVLSGFYDYFKTEAAALLGHDPLNQMINQYSRPFQRAIAELVINVAYHGGDGTANGLGFACYHRWPKGHSRFRFSCSDVGVGFRTSLLRKEDVDFVGNDDVTAILVGILYRLLRPMDAVVGLYHALAFVRSFRGSLKIRSGRGFVELEFSRAAIRRIFDDRTRVHDLDWLRAITTRNTCAPVCGTHVVLDLTLPDPGKRDRASN